MCGRYYRKSDKQKIAESFHVKHVDDFPLPPADYNVAPSTNQPIIRNNRDTGDRELVSLRWGLIPFLILLANSSKTCRLILLGRIPLGLHPRARRAGRYAASGSPPIRPTYTGTQVRSRRLLRAKCLHWVDGRCALRREKRS
ncbi:SOS response-associated peptidase family protein [Edaphobacter aggregans]|uniref:SOS response-associated peptidase family protein n=1 Tax=Edaphobacter aggregans TaxID=570835 RepID=UPI0009FC28AC|nr:SOS response-associated peptidase family protein [Edaphobacter aggregans]